jgi:hypothetical protein
VVGERDPQRVGDHAAPRPAGRAEAVRGELPRSGRRALGGQPAPARRARPARHGPRHHDRLPDLDLPHVRADGDDLRDALVPDRERPLERDRAADAADDGIDDAQRDAGLQRARDGPVDRERVAVAAAGDERADDRVARIAHLRRAALAPREMPAADQVELAHAAILA